MNARMKWILMSAALLIPIAAWAQHAAPPAKPSVEAARPVAPAPADDPGSDDDRVLDEMLALGGDDELMTLGDGPEGEIEKSVGANGERRVVSRRTERLPGGHGGMRMRHGGGGMMGGGGHGMRGRFAGLDLTDEQRAKMRDLHEAQARKAVQRRADMQLAKLDLHKLMREDRPNSATVNLHIDRIARLHAEGLKARFETHMQARALLTPEQRKQLQSGPQGGMHHEMGDFETPPKR